MPPRLTVEQVRAQLATLGRAKKLQNEAAFTRQVLDFAKLFGWKRAHFRPARVIRKGVEKYETPVAGDGRGFLDLLLIRGKRLVVAELKIPPNTMRPEQEEWFAAWDEYGAEAYLWTPTDWDLIERVLR